MPFTDGINLRRSHGTLHVSMPVVALVIFGCRHSESFRAPTLPRHGSIVDSGTLSAQRDAAVFDPDVRVVPGAGDSSVEPAPRCYEIHHSDVTELRYYFSVNTGGGMFQRYFSLLGVERGTSRECVTVLASNCEQTSIDTEGVAHCDDRSFVLRRTDEGVFAETTEGRRIRISSHQFEVVPSICVRLGWSSKETLPTRQ